MADIRPFRAIRFSSRDLSRMVAPPYDILDANDKAALLVRSDRNMVAIDLPFVPPKSAGPPAAYDQAAKTFRAWQADGTLRQDDKPAIYVYHQQYAHSGRTYVRKMFFARLRLEEFGKGQVFPHEQTFGGPKEDRLLLTRATKANLSPIFAVYPDSANTVASALDAAISGREPDARAEADNVENRLWVVSDLAVLDNISGMMREKPVFIADGHHRYGTGLAYRNELGKTGPLPADHAANFVLCVLAGMEDPGLLILPTHRVIHDVPQISVEALKEALKNEFDIAGVLEAKAGGTLMAQLAVHGPLAMAAYSAADDNIMVFSPRDADLLRSYAPDRKPAWRRYGLAILHRYVLDEVITPLFLGGTPATIHYIKDTVSALSDAKANKGLAFIVQSTTMAELRDICTAGELMPQKSTYFFPKLATGMVINPLE